VKATGGLVLPQVESAAAGPVDAPGRARAALVARERHRRRRSNLKMSLFGRCLYYTMVATLHLLSLLPDFVLRQLGVLGGCLGYKLDRRHVRIGVKNLEIAFPDVTPAARARILRDYDWAARLRRFDDLLRPARTASLVVTE